MAPSDSPAPAAGRPLVRLLVTAAVAVTGAVAVLLPLSQSPTVQAAPAPAVLSAPALPAPSSAPSQLASARVASVPTGPLDGPLLAAQAAAGLACTASEAGTPLCVHGHDTAPPVEPGRQVAAGTTGTAAGSTGGRLGCYGDGTSGPRVRAVYAHVETATDRYAALLPDLERWAAGVSGQVDESAQATGGRRHVRFATTGGTDCRLAVLRMPLPAAAFESFDATVDALQARGLSVAHSKYLVWADTDRLCGLATTFADHRPGAENLNDGATPGYARVDRPCWGQVEAHELVHMLGGVQASAPHSTGGFHCNDGRDVMCYDDGTARSTQTAVCPASRARLLDCGSDDYFSTAPAAGSYLAQHWNTARSSFLAAAMTDPARPSPSPSASPSPAPSPTAKPTGGGSEAGKPGLLPSLVQSVPVPVTTRPATAPRTATIPPATPVPSALPVLTSLVG